MNEMNYYSEDVCCLCLSTSNEKFSNKSSKCPDNLTPYDKIKIVFLELPSVMNSDDRICLKCSDFVDSIYKFNRTCLENINILSSYKSVLKENKLKKQCDVFVNNTEAKQFEENTFTSKEVKIEPPESPINNDVTLHNSDFASESHSNGAAEVKKEIEFNNEICDKEPETSCVYPEVKREIEEFYLKEEWTNGIQETSENLSLKTENEDFENNSILLTGNVTNEKENIELLNDPLLEVTEGSSVENQELSASIGEIQSDHVYTDTDTDEEPHKCDICGKIFTKSYLEVHMMIHTSEKSHKCDICGKLFQIKSKLNLHMLSHTGEKPHKCNFCDKSFKRKDSLKLHVLLHTGEKPYFCGICGKQYIYKQNLNVHMLTHTGEKPYFCGICGKQFIQKCHLDLHMLTHTGEKPHKCDTCGKSYTRKQKLKSHMLVHTNEKSGK